VEDQTEKDRLIDVYHKNTAKKVCRYFKPENADSCKFGNKCFYRHENTDGSAARSDSPTTIARRTRQRVPNLSDFIDLESLEWAGDENTAELENLIAAYNIAW